MRVISVQTLKEFWLKHPDSEQPLTTWYKDTQLAQWQTPNDIKAKHRSASILKNGRVVFNIAGNKYRLVVGIDYEKKFVFIKFIGDHRTYDKINVDFIEIRRESK